MSCQDFGVTHLRTSPVPQTPAALEPAGWRRLVALRPGMVDFQRRGFRTEPAEVRTVLEAGAGAFLAGFNAELATPAGEAPDLDHLPPHHRGFAAEGAAMAAALLDHARPFGGRRLAAVRQRHAARYTYLLHVGSGWALAKLRRSRLGGLGAEEPLLRWLGYDGMGFCQAFFATERQLRRWYRHHDRCPSTCDIRYQGMGRSLWFRECGDPEAVARRIRLLPPRHRGDAWSGAALAATYAGGVSAPDYAALHRWAVGHHAELAQGAAFGAEAWRLSGHVPAFARLAVDRLAGATVEQAAEWTWAARAGLDRPGADADDYRSWRVRIQQLAGRHGTRRPD